MTGMAVVAATAAVVLIIVAVVVVEASVVASAAAVVVRMVATVDVVVEFANDTLETFLSDERLLSTGWPIQRIEVALAGFVAFVASTHVVAANLTHDISDALKNQPGLHCST